MRSTFTLEFSLKTAGIHSAGKVTPCRNHQSYLAQTDSSLNLKQLGLQGKIIMESRELKKRKPKEICIQSSLKKSDNC